MLPPGLRPQHCENGRKGTSFQSMGGAWVTSDHRDILIPRTWQEIDLRQAFTAQVELAN